MPFASSHEMSYLVRKDRIFSSPSSVEDEALVKKVVNNDQLWKELRNELSKNRAVTSAAVAELSQSFLNKKMTRIRSELVLAEQIKARRKSKWAQQQHGGRQSSMLVDDMLYPTRGFTSNNNNNNNNAHTTQSESTRTMGSDRRSSTTTTRKQPVNLMEYCERKSPGAPMRRRKNMPRHTIGHGVAATSTEARLSTRRCNFTFPAPPEHHFYEQKCPEVSLRRTNSTQRHSIA
eukprot:CAMPEP_0116851064 /NCGR_PEP_ID=MMETSP0418-20121206/16505_1 /TAXON_ID=1158023 /ORGANISM="Astrosyne radiata, Strain 13vi08-1A" /LENGTH=232 /DNA_ID=CAMNT_0004483025 /DNA_START=98 /DNA_END=796 /DNA_ORIENTATION=-